MSVKIRNHTDYPTTEVRRLVRRAFSYFDVDNVDVEVRYYTPSCSCGRYHASWRTSLGQTREWMTLRVPRPEQGSGRFYSYDRRDGVGEFELADWREALVAAAAHEGTHHRQTPRNGYGFRGKRRYNEAECDRAAYRAVVYHREDTARRRQLADVV